jgi:hypothetical protein
MYREVMPRAVAALLCAVGAAGCHRPSAAQNSDATRGALVDAPDRDPDAPDRDPDAPDRDPDAAAPDAPDLPSVLSVGSAGLDVGPASIGQLLQPSLTVTNDSAATVFFNAVITGDPAFGIVGNSGPIPPNGSASIELEFMPYAEGVHIGNLALTTPGREALNVTLQGETYTALSTWVAGSGSVSSSDGSIACSGGLCSGMFVNPIVLTATPLAGNQFVGWSDPTCGTSTTCAVGQEAFGRFIDAYFAATSTQILTVTFAGNANGALAVNDTSNAGELIAACTTSCQVPVPLNHSVQIVASSLSSVVGISGACSGVQSCTFTPPGSAAISVTFQKDPTEGWSRALATGPVLGAAYDANGDVVVATDAFPVGPQAVVAKLDGTTGATVWAHPLEGGEVQIGSNGMVYVLNSQGTSLNFFAELDGNGYSPGYVSPNYVPGTDYVSSSNQIGPPAPALNEFPQRMAIDPSGTLFVASAGGEACVQAGFGGSAYCVSGEGSRDSLLATSTEFYVPIWDGTSQNLAVISRADGTVQTTSGLGDVPTTQIALLTGGDVVSAGVGSASASLRWLHAGSAAFTRDIALVTPVAGLVGIGSDRVFWMYATDYPGSTTGYTAEVVDSMGDVTWSLARAPSGNFGQVVYAVETDGSGSNVVIGGADASTVQESNVVPNTGVHFGAGFVATFRP